MFHILLVDDDASFRRSLAISLEDAQYRVSEAESGMAALEIFHQGRGKCGDIDAVVVDARMPGVDGFWLTDQITAMAPEVCVIMLTAYDYPAKADRYVLLNKPVQVNTLTDMLNRCIALRK